MAVEIQKKGFYECDSGREEELKKGRRQRKREEKEKENKRKK